MRQTMHALFLAGAFAVTAQIAQAADSAADYAAQPMTLEAARARPMIPSVQVRKTAIAPVIDGKLNDAAWAAACTLPLGAALDASPEQSAALTTGAAEARLLWDDSFLYVGFRCLDTAIVSTPAMAHDSDLYREDVCEIFLDAAADGRQWIELQVSPRNQTLDLLTLLTAAQVRCDGAGRVAPEVRVRDYWSFRAWELPQLRTATGRLHGADGSEIGWTAELAMPAAVLLHRLGRRTFSPMTLRANFVRFDYAPAAQGGVPPHFFCWSPVLTGCAHISPGAMGALILVDPAGK